MTNFRSWSNALFDSEIRTVYRWLPSGGQVFLHDVFDKHSYNV